MSQLLRLWNSLSLIQRISLCVVPLVLALSVWSVTRWRHESGFRVL
jgi:hypothetical protein